MFSAGSRVSQSLESYTLSSKSSPGYTGEPFFCSSNCTDSSPYVFDFVTVDVTPLAARRSEQLAPPAGAVSGVCRGPKRNSRGIHGDCESTSSSGSYDTVLSGIDTLQACARICAGCASCRYVSFSLEHHECAWFAQCDMSRLQRWPDGYHTMQIQGTAALL